MTTGGHAVSNPSITNKKAPFKGAFLLVRLSKRVTS